MLMNNRRVKVNRMGKQISVKKTVLIVCMAVIVLSYGISLISLNSNATEAATLTKVSTLSISGIKDKVFTSKAIKQSVVINNGKKRLTVGTDYTIAYKNNIAVGKASIIIKGRGSYTGSVTKTFKIVPSEVVNTSVESSQHGSAQITWEQGIEATGYQIYYSDSEEGDYEKLAGIEESTTCSYLATGLEESKTYYFKVRAYTNVNQESYTGAFSKVVIVKIKKIITSPYDLQLKQEKGRLIIKLTDKTLLKEYAVDRTDSLKSRAEYYWTVNIWIGDEEYSMYLGYGTEEPGLNRTMSPSEMDADFSRSILEDGNRVGTDNAGFKIPTITIDDKTIIWTLEGVEGIDISEASKFVVCNYDVTRTNDYIEVEYLPLEVLR